MTDERADDGRPSDGLAGALAALPVPAIDADFSARTLRRAHGELRMRGEGTISLAGLLSAWDASAVPAIVLLTGVAYGALALVRIVEIFVG